MKKYRILFLTVALLALLAFAVFGIYSQPVDAHSSSYSVRVYRSVCMPKSSGGLGSSISFDQGNERWDTSNMHSGVVNYACPGIEISDANADSLIAPATGYYEISGHVNWAGNANGTRVLAIRKGYLLSPGNYIASQQTPGNSVGTDQSVSTVYKLNAGERVSLWIWQNSGATLNINSVAEYSPEFTMTYLGP